MKLSPKEVRITTTVQLPARWHALLKKSERGHDEVIALFRNSDDLSDFLHAVEGTGLRLFDDEELKNFFEKELTL